MRGSEGTGDGTPATPVPIDATPGGLDLVLVKGELALHGRVEGMTAAGLALRLESGETRRVAVDDLVGIDFSFGALGAAVAAAPPAGQEPNLIITYDGRATAARLSAITEDEVITDRMTFQRQDVDRIVFRDNTMKRPPPPVAEPPPPDEAGPPAGEEAPPPSGGETGEPAPVAPFIAALCPEGKPLGGWVRWEYEERPLAFCYRHENVAAWFTLDEVMHVSPVFQVPDVLGGHDLYMEAEVGRCVDSPGGAMSCSGPGTTVAGRPEEGTAFFSPLNPALTLGWGLWHRELELKCRAKGSSWPMASSVPHGAAVHIGTVWAPGVHGHPSVGQFGVAPLGPCWGDKSVEKPTQACRADARRFYVLPFSGHTEGDWTSLFTWHKISWKVCCGCGERPTGPSRPGSVPPPERNKEDCFQTALLNQQSFEHRFEQAKEGLPELLREFQYHYNETLFNVEAWRGINMGCGIMDIALQMGESVIKEGDEFAKHILELRELVQKIQEGKLTWLLSEEDAFSVEQAEKLAEAYQAYFGSAEALQSRLDSCAIMGDIFPKMYKAAGEFLRHREETHRLASKLRQRMQRIERLRIDYRLESGKYHRECVACAERQGLDPSGCPPPPQP